MVAPRASRPSHGRFDGFRFSTAKGTTLLADEQENAIDPKSRVLRAWHHVLLLSTLYEAFVLPFFVTFKPNAPREQPKELYVVVACEALFLVDMVVQAHTGYYDDGNIVKDRSKTRRRYLRSWTFWLDVYTIIPLSFIVQIPRFSRAAMELHKLLRWIKLPTYIATIDDLYAKRFVVVKIVKMVTTTIFLSHFVACLRFSFGYNHSHDDHWLPAEPRHGLHSVRRQYLTSIFWAFGLMSGLFEGELPTRVGEFLFTHFVATCGFSLFTTLCAMFFMISKCESGNSEAVDARINQLKHVLSFHRVPDKLQTQAIEYLVRYNTDVDSNDREVLKLLCPSIKKDIQVELLKDTVARIPLFEGCSEPFLEALTSLLELVSLPAQTTVFLTGDHGDSMYIVNSGVLNIVMNGVTVREVRKGSYFGELSVFLNSPRSATVVSATYSTLYKLTKFHGERLLEGYPSCAGTISARLAQIAKNGADRKSRASLSSSSSASRLELKQLKESAVAVRAKLQEQVIAVSFFNWGKKKNYVLPSVRDTEEGTNGQQQNGFRSSRRSTIEKNAILKDYYDERVAQESAAGVPRFHTLWRSLLFQRCIDAESSTRMWWLLGVETALIYNWIVIPLRVFFPVLQRPLLFIDAANVMTDIILFVDIYLNLNLSHIADGEKIMEPTRSAMYYLKRDFAVDLLSMIPFWTLSSPLARVLRLLRCRNWYQQYQEVSSFLRLTNRGRLVILCFFLVMLYHFIACAHFGITNIEGFSNSEEAWIPSEDIFLEPINSTHYMGENGTIFSVGDAELQIIALKQYFRSLYYATNVLAALGKTVEPESDFQYAIALVFMLSGFLITAIVVDNVQKRITASAYEQKEFYAMRTKIQLFLRRQKAPDSIFQRVNSFLDFWWSSHRGAFISELIADLPAPMKLEILHSICNPALQALALLPGVRPVLEKLGDFFVTSAALILYGQGEVVYRQGDYANGLFFLLEGEVCVIANAQDPRTVPVGSFFGSAALKPNEASHGYGEHVSATKGSILLFVTKDHLVAMEGIFPGFSRELVALEIKLMRNKLMKTDILSSKSITSGRRSTMFAAPPEDHSLCTRLFGPAQTAFDPDSKLVVAWEIWVFVAMTVQWLTVTVQMCFRMKKARYLQADVVTAVLELSFFVDIYVRSRVGYYAFGNKIMNPATIRRNYLQSRAFLIDALSLTPLYVVNWSRPASARLDALNANKVLRVLKVPRQLRALETRYLKRTTELRLFKLFYYTFLLAHMFGCMWFDFASKSSRVVTFEGNRTTEFGKDAWLPPAKFEYYPLNLQYFASIFWSFGLMSASSTGELPKTSLECFFSVITMTSGFFLFAYVVGNFTDIIDLVDGDNREFVWRLAAARMMLKHFSLPKSIEDRVKTYYAFQRFHTITQEHHLERCLPPSLLTDIRLVHLKPMIAKVSFLSGMEGSVTRMLVSQFHQKLVLRDEYVCKYGEEGYDMFFVFTGILDVLLPSNMVTSEDESDLRQVDQELPACSLETEDPLMGRVKKVNELTAGSYFGENGLFTKALRNAYVRASTSCILYKLSRESLELVFERYPQWKEKVLRIANLQREQIRLARLSADEQNRHTDESNGSMLSRIDVINRRAERLEEELQLVRLRRMESSQDVNAHTVKAKKFLDRVLWEPLTVCWTSLSIGTDAQSSTHRKWLRLMLFCSVFTAWIIPYRVAVDPLSQMSVFGEVMKAIEIFCEVMFIVDIRFSWCVHECANSMELYEERYQSMYIKERLLWDLIAACPLDRLLTDFTTTSWLRLLRCAKMINVWSYMEELNRRSIAREWNHFRGVCLIYGMAIYWAACSYLVISNHFGFGTEWSSWRPAEKLKLSKDEMPSTEIVALRMLRGLFFGFTCFVKKGKTFIPDATGLYIFTVLTCFVGMLVMSFMISEFAALYISYIWNEVEYRKNHIAVELYLDRVKVSEELKQRTQRFMSSLWSSHAGVNYAAIIVDLPRSIRSDAIVFVIQRPMRLFTGSIFRSLACDVRTELDEFTHSLARSLHFEGYPRDENVVSEGTISRAMFFVVRGHLWMSSRTNSKIARSLVRKDQYFGDRGLLACAVSTYTVRTIRACDLFSLSSEAFLQVLEDNAFTHVALTLVRRAQDKLAESAACSRDEMETRWGATILSELRALHAESSGEPQLSRMHIERLAGVVNDAADCMRLFQAFLGLVLPFDPLDWAGAADKRRLSKHTARATARKLKLIRGLMLQTEPSVEAVEHDEAVAVTRDLDEPVTVTADLGEPVDETEPRPIADAVQTIESTSPVAASSRNADCQVVEPA